MKSLGIFVFGLLLGCLTTFVWNSSQKPNVPVAAVPPPSPTPAPKCPECPCGYSNEILPPPAYASSLAKPLVTNRDGEVRVAWQEVQGAKSYKIHLENSAGKTVISYKTSRTVMYLKEIPVPEGAKEVRYNVRLATVNGLDVEGDRGEIRELVVKPMGSLMAPRVREIRIED